MQTDGQGSTYRFEGLPGCASVSLKISGQGEPVTVPVPAVKLDGEWSGGDSDGGALGSGPMPR